MTKDELKLALKHAKRDERHLSNVETRYWCDQYKLLATQAIEALAQPEQEPVAFMFQHDEVGRCVFSPNDSKDPVDTFLQLNPRYHLVGPLYTTPPQRTWVGITDEEILSISADCASSHQHMDIHFARAIEAKLRSKNS